ncbi:MAG TPA: type II toxin-antitoxin system VapC family toxin [Thermomicrobiales bacterium]|jgi:predicted nucleic acid-binding protein
MKYLVDIDWVIDALANIPAAITPLRQLAHDGIAVSMISFGELYDGAYGSRVPLTEIARIQQFLSSYPVINLSDAIMDRFAQTRTLLRSQGMLIPNMDILIALAHNLTLLTRNVRHFQRIPGLARYQP